VLARLVAGLLGQIEESLSAFRRFIGDLHEQRATGDAGAAAEARQLVRRRGLGKQRLEFLAAALVAVCADMTDADPHGATIEHTRAAFQLVARSDSAERKRTNFFLLTARGGWIVVILLTAYVKLRSKPESNMRKDDP
jgi:hypothetical protein